MINTLEAPPPFSLPEGGRDLRRHAFGGGLAGGEHLAEREGEREREIIICLHIYIYIYIYI